jgi:hypothetical protein
MDSKIIKLIRNKIILDLINMVKRDIVMETKKEEFHESS